MVLLEPLLSPQEGRRHETSNQIEGVEHLCSTPSLQDGGPTHTERPPEDRRLDDQGRSEGRILHDPDTQLRQISPLLPSPKSSLTIHMPTIRPVLCSLGLYQDPEASLDPAQRAGCQVSGIHRRCIDLSRDCGEGERPHKWSDISTGEFGFSSPPGENSARANSGDRIPGNDSRFKDERTAPTWPEIEEDKAGGCKDQRSTSHTLCPGGVTPTREIQLSFPGSASRSSLQQSSTEGPSRSLGVRRPMLRNPVPPLPCSKGGAGVVGQPVVPVEWEESGAETARPSNRIRRIPHRLGSSMPGDADRGTMVAAGEVPPHQLPRAPGSNASGENVPERSGRQESFAAARQPDSSDLHKQSGQDSLRPGHNNGERALDVVPTKGYPSDSTTSARSGEREGRHRVKSDEGSLRLDV